MFTAPVDLFLFDVAVPGSVENSNWYVIASDAREAAGHYLRAVKEEGISVDDGEMANIGRLEVTRIPLAHRQPGILAWEDTTPSMILITPDLHDATPAADATVITAVSPDLGLFLIQDARDPERAWHTLAVSETEAARAILEKHPELCANGGPSLNLWSIPAFGRSAGLIPWEETIKSEIRAEPEGLDI